MQIGSKQFWNLMFFNSIQVICFSTFFHRFRSQKYKTMVSPKYATKILYDQQNLQQCLVYVTNNLNLKIKFKKKLLMRIWMITATLKNTSGFHRKQNLDDERLLNVLSSSKLLLLSFEQLDNNVTSRRCSLRTVVSSSAVRFALPPLRRWVGHWAVIY